MRKISRQSLLQGAAASLASAQERIIDPYVHVWKHDPRFPFAQGARVPERDATPETLLGLMKANGVSKTVIIQVIHYRYDDAYLASVLKQYKNLRCDESKRRVRRSRWVSAAAQRQNSPSANNPELQRRGVFKLAGPVAVYCPSTDRPWM
jgi:predicted TIM-barrel fold metal-dependent hydrolase